MRVALIVVAVAFVASPSLASPSCMTQAEARKHFGNKHLYWHGPNRCWDATPGRRQLAQRIKARESRPAVRNAQVERTPAEEKKQPDWTHESRWREAMSKMLPEDYASLQPQVAARAQVQVGSEPVEPPSPRVNWRDRWVDVAQSVPPIVGKSEPAGLVPAAAANAEPIITPLRVMLALLAFVLMLGIIEIVNRGAIFSGWRKQ
jgi:hypothetical protein